MKGAIFYAVVCLTIINILAVPPDQQDADIINTFNGQLQQLIANSNIDPILIPIASTDHLRGRLIWNDIIIRGLSSLNVDTSTSYNLKVNQDTHIVNVTLVAHNLRCECDFVYYKTVILRFEGHGFGNISSLQIPMQYTIHQNNPNNITIDNYKFDFKNIEWDLTTTDIRTILVYNPLTKKIVQAQFHDAVIAILQTIAENIMQLAIGKL
ncbi:uncharacterized protein [Atheta coriaria]|uniref:uncharacterized protein n=1 Tax=Dalotia coriaria TaxID=877792 RepID=UPI0031F375C2